MIADLEDYIEKHISEQPELLNKIDRDTNLYHLNGRMCSGHIQGRLLKMLTQMIKPARVIELGTFTGFSALSVAEALDDGAMLHTIEADDELEEVIKENFSKSEHASKITLHIGDALQTMDQFPDNHFDLAIIDADKREYPLYFEKLLRLVRPGGFMIADNTLWDGHVTENGKHSSQTSGIIEFNDMVVSCPEVEVAIIPIRDGVSLIHKKYDYPPKYSN